METDTRDFRHSSPPGNSFKVVALLAFYNEGDIIAQVVRDLIAQGLLVYAIDNGSTDDSVSQLEPLVGQGVLATERFAPNGDKYDWTGILRRKEQLARELDADWFLHHDADEFRESPWPQRTLKEAIEAVDALGYNAVDFELLNFVPTHDCFKPRDDVRQAFPFFERGEPFNKLQIRCWKRAPDIDLVSSGGHDATFEGRRVFPIRFLLRHYPIRGPQHGERKVFVDRLPRFSDTERAQGWHIQYESIRPGSSFVRDPRTLTRYEGEKARLDLAVNHRVMEDRAHELERLENELNDSRTELLSTQNAAAMLAKDLDASRQAVERIQAELSAAQQQTTSVVRELEINRARVDALERSWSWRLTRPGRIVAGWFLRKRSGRR